MAGSLGGELFDFGQRFGYDSTRAALEYAEIARELRLAAAEIAMVGDRLYTDVLMARRAGALGVLVLTGEATAEDAARSAEPPDLTLPSLVELGELLASSR